MENSLFYSETNFYSETRAKKREFPQRVSTGIISFCFYVEVLHLVGKKAIESCFPMLRKIFAF